MRLETKIVTLVAASAAIQAAAVSGFFYLQWSQDSLSRTLELTRSDIEGLRDFREFITTLGVQSAAAAMAGSGGELALLAQSGRSRISPIGAAYDEFMRAVEGAADSSGRSLGAVDSVALIGIKQAAVAAEIQGIIESREASWRASSRRGAARMRWARSLMVLFTLLAASVSLGLAWWWIVDMRRAFRAVNDSLTSLGRGEVPRGNPDGRGDEIGLLLVTMKKVGAQAQEMHQTMTRWDRLAAMGQLAGGVAHEINNPLTGVIGQAELLRERISSDAQSVSMLEKILRAARRCKKIVRSLLDFSRQKEGEFEEAGFDKILDAVLEMVGSELETAGISLEREIEPGLTLAKCRPVDISEVLLNVILNARDAMPKGGKLIVRASIKELGTVATIEIEDSGVGMTPDVLPRVFEAFYTTKGVGHGTGLGLSVAYGIIRDHQGTLEAFSDGLGRGARFVIKLPGVAHPVLEKSLL